MKDSRTLARSVAAPSLQIALAANFTADPVANAVQRWCDFLDLSATVVIAPYDQTFQQLIDPTSLLRRNPQGINVVMLRLADWWQACANGDDGSQAFTQIVDDFATALDSAVQATSIEHILVLCPSSELDDAAELAVAAAHQQLLEVATNCSGVGTLTAAEVAACYPVDQVDDPHARELADLPYTPVFFSALGTALARRVYAVTRAPAKVIVLDCDNTLWSGLCGELGPTGVTIGESHAALQRFVKQQQCQGKLICLASRNNEADVRAVFESNPNMILRSEDITAMQVHWGLKSDSLERLGRDLGLGLDSFVFIDDDPVQCAEVNRRFPQVLALTLPGVDEQQSETSEAQTIEQFCQHIWPLDQLTSTSEGQRRTASYRDHAKREQLRHQSLSLSEFLDGLALQVNIEPLSEELVSRAAELTHRTNQFNLTGLRLSEALLARELVNGVASRCFTVHVSDRFGDYGVVGLITLDIVDSILAVPVFLLSCRALGRGVEHWMAAFIGAQAQRDGFDTVRLHCRKTDRNQPGQAFIHSLGATDDVDIGGTITLTLSAADAAAITYDGTNRAVEQDIDPIGQRAAQAVMPAPPGHNVALSRVPIDLCEPQKIHQWMLEGRTPPSAVVSAASAEAALQTDTDPVERVLREAFKEVLGVDDVDASVGFLYLGGHSLQAMQVLARVNEAFDVTMDPTLLFTTDFSIAELKEEVHHLQASRGQTQGIDGVLDLLSSLTDD